MNYAHGLGLFIAPLHFFDTTRRFGCIRLCCLLLFFVRGLRSGSCDLSQKIFNSLEKSWPCIGMTAKNPISPSSVSAGPAPVLPAGVSRMSLGISRDRT